MEKDTIENIIAGNITKKIVGIPINFKKIEMVGIEILKLLGKYNLNFFEESELLITILRTIMIEEFLDRQNEESLLKLFKIVKNKNENNK